MPMEQIDVSTVRGVTASAGVDLEWDALNGEIIAKVDEAFKPNRAGAIAALVFGVCLGVLGALVAANNGVWPFDGYVRTSTVAPTAVTTTTTTGG